VSEIRPLARAELAEIAELYRLVLPSEWSIPEHEGAAWFDRILFGDPWADAEIPSLVHVEDSGEISGFIGSHVRRICFDDRTIRIAASGPLVVHPTARSRAVGPRLWRQYVAGPQELTFTDGATDEAAQILELIGGQMLHPSSVAWARVFRPFSFMSSRALESRPHAKVASARVWPAADSLAARTVRYFAVPDARGMSTEPLTSELMLEHLPVVTRSLRLFPAYDKPFLDWLFAEFERNSALGTVVRRIVRDANARVLGWYVYFLRHGEGCQVAHVAARDRHAGDVLDALFADAFRHGGAAVQGRVEPRLLGPLADRGSLFRYSASGTHPLVYSKDPELLAVLASPQALLTRLDGELWLSG